MAAASSHTLLCPGSPGDLIVFQRSIYKHYAVNVGNGEIAHVTGSRDGFNSLDIVDGVAGHIRSANPDVAVIKKEKFSDFYKNVDRVYVEKDKKKQPLPCAEIVKRALSKVDEKGYNLFWKNCEHFARWCCYGEEESTQANTLMVALATTAALFGAVWIASSLLTNDSNEDEREHHT